MVELSPGESTELVQTPGDEEAVLVQHLPGNKVGKRQTLPGKPCATNILKIAEILLMELYSMQDCYCNYSPFQRLKSLGQRPPAGEGALGLHPVTEEVLAEVGVVAELDQGHPM